jgi:glycosyltransferase involved in cell wall biosynthesis
VLIAFPLKSKSAKYAGNWDPLAKQPLSYRFQKWLLSNTFLTRRMKVLVYGEWPGQSRNVQPFFTATYSSEEALTIAKRKWEPPFHFVFAGTLSPGKQPLYALQLLHRLQQVFDLELSIYGEGPERDALEQYLEENELKWATLHGNVDKGTIKQAMQRAHFLILPSRSEGWPKVVAEAMWWGAIPMVTPISCVPWMLEKGKRGVLLEGDLEQDAAKVVEHLGNGPVLEEMSTAATQWSRQYTLDRFEKEIGKLLR